MDSVYNLIISNFKLFLAIAFRIGGLLFTAPFFGHRTIPFYVKLGLVLFISLILLPISLAKGSLIPEQLPSYLVLLAKEALIGALFGLLFYMLFWGIEMGGNLLDLQLNLGGFSEESSPISRLQVFLGLLVFLALNGHHLLISGIYQSFELIPSGQLNLSSFSLNSIAEFSGSVFIIALKISAPVIITLLMVDILIGVLTRTATPSNLYQNFIPLRLGAGLLILGLSFPILGIVMERLLLNTDLKLVEVLKELK